MLTLYHESGIFHYGAWRKFAFSYFPTRDVADADFFTSADADADAEFCRLTSADADADADV